MLDLALVGKCAMVSRGLRHCWIEFRDTLHGQKTLNATGSMEVSRWRATATAGGFFTESALVDTRLRTEFFRHLPGILTGLGTIGTFSGLILGLQGFQVTDDANTVRNSLQGLLNAVGGAFLVSDAAITLAMLADLSAGATHCLRRCAPPSPPMHPGGKFGGTCAMPWDSCPVVRFLSAPTGCLAPLARHSRPRGTSITNSTSARQPRCRPGAGYFANVTSGLRSSRRARHANPRSSKVTSRSQPTLLARCSASAKSSPRRWRSTASPCLLHDPTIRKQPLRDAPE